jgi:molecular chaperone DnaJ
MSRKDPYEVLGVDRDASPDDIKKAYRRLALQYHPDRNPGDRDAEERFKDISIAYEVLNNPEKRSNFDRFGTADGTPDLSDIFGGFGLEDAIRSFMENFGMGGFQGSSRRERRGEDVGLSVELSLAEAALGAKRELKVRRAEPCPGCSGTGADPSSGEKECSPCGGHGRVRSTRRTILGTISTVETCQHCGGRGRKAVKQCGSCSGSGSRTVDRTIAVDIPAGIEEGHVLRIRGQGHQPGEAIPGDLAIHVRRIDYGPFSRDGDDLVIHMPVSFPDAALGCRTEIPLADGGRREFEIPPGTQPGEVLTVRGEGLGHLRARGRGDIRLVVEVQVPRRLTGDEKKVLRDLQTSRSFKH